jgi:hypothetical protein
MKARCCWLVAIVALLVAGMVRAETRRVAVVVGNNAGSGEQPPLRYAETDAGKMARVLVELGGVAASDLFLLQGRNIAALRQTLALARQRVAAHQENPADRVILIFYFSGHSDGRALELGRDRLAFSELRRWLTGTQAEVRLAFVDSCKSGALLAAKGGTPGPAFQIRLNDELASIGEALLTSSAADEIALESREIGGSFFTHHFISGLRGAADASGDGLVTLTEAYQYAYVHTITTTGATVAGPQHPVYDYRLSGQGELVLTELSRPTALIELPGGFERALVIELVRDQVIAELAADGRAVVAVLPGRYAVRAWREGRAFAGRIQVKAGETRVVRWDELTVMIGPQARAKGSLAADVRTGAAARHTARDAGGLTVLIAGGGQGGVASGLGPLSAIRAGVRSATPSGLSLMLDLGTGTGGQFRETSAFVLGGYRLGLARGPLQAWAGVEAGVGGVLQSSARGASGVTAAVAGGPWAGVSLRVLGRMSASVEGHLPVAALRRDGELAGVLLPAVWLGLLVAL